MMNKNILITLSFIVICLCCSSSYKSNTHDDTNDFRVYTKTSCNDVSDPIEISTEELLARSFIVNQMTTDEGGVWSNLKDNYPKDDSAGVNHEILSESMGMIMLYAYYARDKELFDKALGFVTKYMETDSHLLAWKLNSEYETISTSNASIDDLRVLKAIYLAYSCWKNTDYKKVADTILQAVYKYNTSSTIPKILVECASWDDEGVYACDDLTLSYSDAEAMSIISKYDSKWNDIISNTVSILRNASLDNGLYHKEYFTESSEYDDVSGEELSMIGQMLIATALADAGESTLAGQSLTFVKSEFDKYDNKLPSRYYSDATPVLDDDGDFNESVSVYSIVAILADKLGDNVFRDKILNKIKSVQIKDNEYKTNPVYGAFLFDIDGTVNVYSQLYAIIAMSHARN